MWKNLHIVDCLPFFSNFVTKIPKFLSQSRRITWLRLGSPPFRGRLPPLFFRKSNRKSMWKCPANGAGWLPTATSDLTKSYQTELKTRARKRVRSELKFSKTNFEFEPINGATMWEYQQQEGYRHRKVSKPVQHKVKNYHDRVRIVLSNFSARSWLMKPVETV